MNKKTYFIYAFIAGLLVLGFALSLNVETLELFPMAPSSGIQFHTSHEGVEKNWSQASAKLKSDGTLSFQYKLSSAQTEPFAGVFFSKYAVKDSFFNFSSFDLLTIGLKAKKAKRIPIYITINYTGKMKTDNLFPSLPLVYVIEYEKEGIYTINKKDFEIPSWWLRYQGLKKEDLGVLDLSKVNYILINSCQLIGSGIEDEIVIQNIRMSGSNKINYWLFGGAILLLAGTFAVHKMLQRKKVLVPYRVQNVEPLKEDGKAQRIVHFIAQNYSNPDLSVEDLQNASGISAREVGTIIKKEFDTTFKSYLNFIRLTEVKRLLNETDLPVSDIAYRAGYNNISHFNRLFKKEFGLSPKEFREVNKTMENERLK